MIVVLAGLIVFAIFLYRTGTHSKPTSWAPVVAAAAKPKSSAKKGKPAPRKAVISVVATGKGLAKYLTGNSKVHSFIIASRADLLGEGLLTESFVQFSDGQIDCSLVQHLEAELSSLKQKSNAAEIALLSAFHVLASGNAAP
jgi:hypothetical protein